MYLLIFFIYFTLLYYNLEEKANCSNPMVQIYSGSFLCLDTAWEPENINATVLRIL